MATVNDIVLEVMRIAPGWLAEEWDNVGLLVGDGAAEVQRVMTCLTVTPATAAEAIVGGAGLVVAHHPMPFRPLKRLTGDTTVGRLLLDLIAARVAVCSAHTAFDSAELGINARLAEGLGWWTSRRYCRSNMLPGPTRRNRPAWVPAGLVGYRTRCHLPNCPSG